MIKKRILVVGSNGMLGQSVVQRLLNRQDVELWLASAEESSWFNNTSYTKLNIADKKEVKDLILSFYPDFIINLAAYTNVDKCEIEKEVAWNINVNGVEYLAKYAVSSNAHLIQISTDYVFDGLNGPYSEDEMPNPIGYYGRTKLAGENILKKFDINHTILRTNVLFGPTTFGRPDFVKWVYDSLKNKNKIKIVTDQINNPTYLDDLALAIIGICDSKITGLFNIGGAELLNRYEFTKQIAEYFKLDFSLVEPILTKDLNQLAPRPLKSGLRNIKAQAELKYEPKPLVECFNLMRTHLE